MESFEAVNIHLVAKAYQEWLESASIVEEETSARTEHVNSKLALSQALLRKALQKLSGDLNYDNIAEAKKILHTVLGEFV